MHEVKYMTIEQCELYRKLAEKYHLKGNFLPSSIICYPLYKRGIDKPLEQKPSGRRK
jgi:hypothetical protein